MSFFQHTNEFNVLHDCGNLQQIFVNALHFGGIGALRAVGLTNDYRRKFVLDKIGRAHV